MGSFALFIIGRLTGSILNNPTPGAVMKVLSRNTKPDQGRRRSAVISAISVFDIRQETNSHLPKSSVDHWTLDLILIC